LEWVIFRISRHTGSTGVLTLAGLASTVSARTGSIASATIGSTAFGFNRFGGSPLFVGGWGWGGWGGDPAPVAASEPIVVGAGAPLIINVGADPGPGDAGSAYSGGCVIHKLNYDSNGKYVGERQIPLC
jgi:hypothetical protein